MMKQTTRITTIIAAALMMAIISLPALADNFRYSEREVWRIAQRNAYEFGLREGRLDRREGRRFDPKRLRAYKEGRMGYRDEYHHDESYREGFRNGFVAGYEDGYNGNGFRRRDDFYDRRDSRDDIYDRRDRRDDDDDYRRDRGYGRRGRPWWMY